MLFSCEFTWFPGVTREQVAQHDAGANNRDRTKGWCNLAGGGAGFLLVEHDDARQLTAFLQPYMDLMSFDVRAIYALDHEARVKELRDFARSAAPEPGVARHDVAGNSRTAPISPTWPGPCEPHAMRQPLRLPGGRARLARRGIPAPCPSGTT
jgi:hypothetical protein